MAIPAPKNQIGVNQVVSQEEEAWASGKLRDVGSMLGLASALSNCFEKWGSWARKASSAEQFYPIDASVGLDCLRIFVAFGLIWEVHDSQKSRVLAGNLLPLFRLGDVEGLILRLLDFRPIGVLIGDVAIHSLAD
jgi:hypothetical protein